MAQSNRIQTVSEDVLHVGSFTEVVWIIAFALLTALGAQIEIPHLPVPYTLQTFFVLLAGGMLGKRKGAASQLLYLLMGCAGLPVFSGLHAGLPRLIGPTGGYLLSFPVAAYAVGMLIEDSPTLWRSAVAMLAGLFIIFTLGTIHLYFTYLHNWTESITSGFLIFSWWDILKLSAASALVHGTAGKWRSRRG